MRKLFVLSIVALVSVLPGGLAIAGGGGGSCLEPLTDGRSATVEMVGLCFEPSVTRVEVGETVTFVNRDQVPHMIIGNGARTVRGDWAAWNELDIDDSIAFRFRADGIYPFVCMYHAGMLGAVVVGDGVSSEEVREASVEQVEPVVEREPLIFHIPKAMDEPAESSVAGTAALVWGGAAGGFLGGLVLLRAARRSDRREP